MNYLSVCSGIEAASAAWLTLGWEPMAFSEIAKFPSATLKHHYPTVPNWGDMTRFKEWPDATVDVLIGGTPCQSFSVSGLREGLGDPRGELMLTFGSIAKHYRPRWLVWENVPGVLSSNGGRDFGTFLGMLAECGYGFAYRVLDAQYFGLAQRRKRVFVVGYLGDWRPPAAVLFDSQALSGNASPRQTEKEEITGTLPPRTGSGGGFGTDLECANGRIPVLSPPCQRNSSGFPNDYHLSGGLIPVIMATSQANASVSVGDKPTLTAYHDLPLVFQSKASPSRSMSFSKIAPTLDVGKCGGLAVINSMAVRQLTPREWERLMGFPDDYTLIPYPKRLAADTPRYMALGNSIAVPVLRWIGQRIQMVDEIKSKED